MKNIVWGLLTQPSIHNRITALNKIETNSAIGRDLQSKARKIRILVTITQILLTLSREESG